MACRTAALDKFSEKLKREFKVKTQAEDRLSYIGLDIRTTNNGDRIVAQGGCRQRILERFHDLLRTSKKTVKSLANTEAFRLGAERDTRPLDQRRRKVYLSGVMSCMFLSRLTRYDMLFWNTYLSTKCSAPAECDMEDLVRMLKYLECSGNWGIRYRAKVKVVIRIYCDSSHAQHLDGRGHMGILIGLGSGMVHARSAVIKMITLSSTESEYVCMCEGTAYVMWMKSFVHKLGFSVHNRPIPKMYQDNNSAIWWSKEDMTFARTKHMMIKRNFVKEAVEDGELIVLACDTKDMPADALTKPLQPGTMKKHMEKMGMESLDE